MHLKIRTRPPEHAKALADEEDAVPEVIDDDEDDDVRGSGAKMEVGGEGGLATTTAAAAAAIDRNRRGDDASIEAGVVGGGGWGGGGKSQTGHRATRWRDDDDEEEDDDEENAEYGDDDFLGGGFHGRGGGTIADAVEAEARKRRELAADRDIIEAAVDPSAWRAETERLGPALRRATREVCGGGDGPSSSSSAVSSAWQPHLEHLHSLANQVAAIAPALREDATGFVGLLRVDLDAVDQREAFLRRHIRLDLHEASFRDAQTNMDDVSARRRSAEERVASHTQELSQLSERCMSTAIAVEDAAGGSGSGSEELTRLKVSFRPFSWVSFGFFTHVRSEALH